jgi:serine/threonine protein kinase
LGDCCHHENVARILDVYVGDVPRLIFQWTDESMLLLMAIASQGCSGQAFSLVQKARMVRDMLNGLAHLHCRGIVHSTLHPSAVVVHFGPERDPRNTQILDLAGAAVLETVTEVSLIGSLEYMAPEVLLGCPKPSPMADVWSAAAVMAFVFTGQSMFEQTPADRHTAIGNIFAVLGCIRPEDIAELSLLPHWSKQFRGVLSLGNDWPAGMVAGGGLGADLLLRRMLFMTPGRCFSSKQHCQTHVTVCPASPGTPFPQIVSRLLGPATFSAFPCFPSEFVSSRAIFRILQHICRFNLNRIISHCPTVLECREGHTARVCVKLSSRRLSMAGCLADDFFRVAPVELGQIERAEAPVAAAALAPPAAPPGQIDEMEAGPHVCAYTRLVFSFLCYLFPGGHSKSRLLFCC